MTLCPVTRLQCVCQPDEGVWCPDSNLLAQHQQFYVEAIAELELMGDKLANALQPFVIHNSSREEISITVLTKWIREARIVLAEWESRDG